METLNFSPAQIDELTGHFGALTAQVPLRPIANAIEYDEAVRAIDALLDGGAADDSHPLAPLVSVVGDFVREYDDRHFRLKDATPAQGLRAIMSQYNIRQSDLPEIGSQGVVSKILNGKRELNVRQIADVSKRFGVSPAVFFAV